MFVTQNVKFVHIFNNLRVIRFVGSQKNRLLRASEKLGDSFIHSSETIYHIDNKKNGVCLFDGQVNLLINFFLKNIITTLDIASCIYQTKLYAIPIRLTIMSVSCDTTNCIYNCFSFFNQTIKKSRFSHIRSSHNCNNTSHLGLFECKSK